MHPPDLFCVLFVGKRRQLRLADEIEIQLRPQQPIGHGGEIFFQRLPLHTALRGRTGGDPKALDRMDDTDADKRRAAGERGVEPRKMIFDERIFLIPRRLIVDGRGIVALCFARHRHPRKVRHAHGHAERRLPIALEFVAAEVKIPVGDAIELGHHRFLAVLMHRRLRLLGGGEFAVVAQHVDAGDGKPAIGAHHLAAGHGLPCQVALV